MAGFKNADAGMIVDELIKVIQEQRNYMSMKQHPLELE